MGRKVLLMRVSLTLMVEGAVFAALLFVSAGTVDWAAGWVFLVIFFGSGLAIVLWLTREDPELLAERLSFPIQREQPLWDKVFIVAMIPLFIAWLILMSLDVVRFEWSEMPSWLQFLGTSGLVIS